MGKFTKSGCYQYNRREIGVLADKYNVELNKKVSKTKEELKGDLDKKGIEYKSNFSLDKMRKLAKANGIDPTTYKPRSKKDICDDLDKFVGKNPVVKKVKAIENVPEINKIDMKARQQELQNKLVFRNKPIEKQRPKSRSRSKSQNEPKFDMKARQQELQNMLAFQKHDKPIIKIKPKRKSPKQSRGNPQNLLADAIAKRRRALASSSGSSGSSSRSNTPNFVPLPKSPSPSPKKQIFPQKQQVSPKQQRELPPVNPMMRGIMGDLQTQMFGKPPENKNKTQNQKVKVSGGMGKDNLKKRQQELQNKLVFRGAPPSSLPKQQQPKMKQNQNVSGGMGKDKLKQKQAELAQRLQFKTQPPQIQPQIQPPIQPPIPPPLPPHPYKDLGMKYTPKSKPKSKPKSSKSSSRVSSRKSSSKKIKKPKKRGFFGKLKRLFTIPKPKPKLK